MGSSTAKTNGSKEEKLVKKIQNKNKTSEEETNQILSNWLRSCSMQRRWVNDLNKMIAKYAKYFKILKVIASHSYVTKSIAFSPDGSTITEIKALKGHSSGTNDAYFSSDGSMVISCGNDRTVRLWDIQTGKQIRELESREWNMIKARLSSDGNTIIALSIASFITLWDVKSGQTIPIRARTLGHAEDVNFSPDGQPIALALNNNIIDLWNIQSNERLKQLQRHLDAVNKIYSVKFASNVQIIVLYLGNDTIQWQDVETGQELVITSLDDGTILLWK
ncbi:WD-40 repeat protein [Reticulomyxa filosa]|uniref:WD-40 repeat protein n=1 Tax=Reticulomyxa filosa TaxID=46433 RepID=X6NLG0_RETFI|nr:WD-40 repeat protein [Reticulomyxa filosa]|eukprot:ETO26549.1 WD-40 repeat protein [Reticulomyxa filosa]